MDINWILLTFDQLSTRQLYSLLELRSDIFIVEQNCAYPDIDGKDQKAYHLLGYNRENILVAYLRILAPGISFIDACIGRVVVRTAYRKGGIGSQLMTTGIEHCRKLYPETGIRISAQAHLVEFYSSLSFKKVSDVYIEDGVPHVQMYLSNLYEGETIED